MSKIQLLLDVVDNMRALADSILAVANTMQGNEDLKPVSPAPVSDTLKPATPLPEPIPTPKPVRETMSAETPAKAVTLPEVRTMLGKLSRDGYTDQIRTLIRKYGGERLGEIDPANFGALLKEAEELPHAAK